MRLAAPEDTGELDIYQILQDCTLNTIGVGKFSLIIHHSASVESLYITFRWSGL
jgi:hypothetical protein